MNWYCFKSRFWENCLQPCAVSFSRRREREAEYGFGGKIMCDSPSSRPLGIACAIRIWWPNDPGVDTTTTPMAATIIYRQIQIATATSTLIQRSANSVGNDGKRSVSNRRHDWCSPRDSEWFTGLKLVPTVIGQFPRKVGSWTKWEILGSLTSPTSELNLARNRGCYSGHSKYCNLYYECFIIQTCSLNFERKISAKILWSPGKNLKCLFIISAPTMTPEFWWAHGGRIGAHYAPTTNTGAYYASQNFIKHFGFFPASITFWQKFFPQISRKKISE